MKRTETRVLFLVAVGIGRASLTAAAEEPPTHDMSYREMVRVMGMDDRAPYHRVLVEQLEAKSHAGTTSIGWEAQAYYGGDYDKLGLKTHGSAANGGSADGEVELLWDRIASRWWSTQLGVRHDWGQGGPSRDWLALGVQGLAPYFFEIEATAYVGEAGRTALRLKASYELLLTQRLILQPQLELEAYGKDEPERASMSGLADLELGLRLRYEIRREFAPYVGVAWERALGNTGNLRRAGGSDISAMSAVAGLRLSF
jgi:copper resistance protein B